jgi:hypothetical protein
MSRPGCVRSFREAPIRGNVVRTVTRSVDAVDARRIVDDNTAITVTAKWARVIAYVKTGSRDMRDKWAECQRHLGIAAVAVQAIGDEQQHPYQTAFDVSGHPDDVAELLSRKVVASWHPVVDVHIGQTASGSGAEVMRKRQPRPIDARQFHGINERSMADEEQASRKSLAERVAERRAASKPSKPSKLTLAVIESPHPWRLGTPGGKAVRGNAACVEHIRQLPGSTPIRVVLIGTATGKRTGIVQHMTADDVVKHCTR